MGLTRIGDETWDLVPSEGGETLLPTDAKADVEFPARWRVFGPTGADATTVDWSEATDYTYHKQAVPLVSAEVEGLSAAPETLSIGDQTFEGRDVEMADGALDFGALFGSHEAGQQAYAMAEMEVARETEVVFGAGCNWWMQWWIDGEEVFENLDAGNTQGFPFSPKFAINSVSATDHCFRRKLGAGKHLLAVRAISGITDWVLRAGIASPRDETLCAVLKPNRWHFLTELNEIRPPEAGRWSHTVAIRTDLCVGDVTMECEFLRPESRGNVGLIFGAQDSDHYYWAQIPGWAQLYRARAQYAAISKTEGTGYIRNLKMQLMHNVPLHGNIWRTLKVERRGSVIQMWVNGVKGPCVHDDTYGAGRIGVAGYSGSHNWAIRNLKVNGQAVQPPVSKRPRAAQAVEAPPWPEGDRRGKPYFEPLADLNPDQLQHAFRLFKLSDDEILMVVMTWPGAYNKPTRNPEDFGVYFYSSPDGGRSWSKYAGPLPVGANRQGQWFVPEPGVIRDVTFDQKRGQFSLYDSVDKGLTWSEEKAGKLTGGWEEMFAENALGVSKITTLVGIAGLTALQDGTVMAQLSRSYGGVSKIMPNAGEGSWGMSNGGQPHCTLSSDQGLTWSKPIPMDYAAQHYGDRSEAPCTDFSETPVAQLPGGRIVAICRPYLSPFMWQTHSDDGGKSWRMACYAPFSGAGGPKLIATRSGYLALIKRGPGLGLNISVDGGLNWDEGTMIDFCTSFNGQAIEAEPDVVLVAHPEGMGENRRFPFRMQRIRITPDGPVSLGTD